MFVWHTDRPHPMLYVLGCCRRHVGIRRHTFLSFAFSHAFDLHVYRVWASKDNSILCRKTSTSSSLALYYATPLYTICLRFRPEPLQDKNIFVRKRWLFFKLSLYVGVTDRRQTTFCLAKANKRHVEDGVFFMNKTFKDWFQPGTPPIKEVCCPKTSSNSSSDVFC